MHKNVLNMHLILLPIPAGLLDRLASISLPETDKIRNIYVNSCDLICWIWSHTSIKQGKRTFGQHRKFTDDHLEVINRLRLIFKYDNASNRLDENSHLIFIKRTNIISVDKLIVNCDNEFASKNLVEYAICNLQYMQDAHFLPWQPHRRL